MTLANRVKRYEAVTHHTATPRTPLMIRVDGRAFHTFTRGRDKPFDQGLIDKMVYAATRVAVEMQGFKAAYIQSDEATFAITDYDTVTTQGWFDYDLSKIISISAALMSVHFSARYPDCKPAVFDSRAFSIPASDVVNAFLWRAQDWKRNSLQMYARAYFSHRELHGKNQPDMHDMLRGIDRNWATDLSPQIRNGTFLTKTEYGVTGYYNILPTFTAINQLIGELFKYPNA